MDNKKKLLFGPDYEYDYKKSPEENWKAAKAFYAKKGIDIGEMPELTEKDFLELGRVLKDLKIEG